MKGSISSSFVWKFSERFFSVGVSVVIQIILARILEPSDFGCLALILSITNFAAIFVNSGISTALIQKRDLDNEDIYTTIVLCFAVAMSLYIVLFFVSPFLSSFYNNPSLKWGLRVLAIILFLNSYNSIQVALLCREMNFKKIFLRSAISIPLSGLIGIILAIKGFGVWSLIIHSLSTSVLNVIIMAIGSKNKFKLFFSPKRAKHIYSFSGYIMLASVISGLCDMLRSLIIGKKYATTDLAFYDKGFAYSSYVSQVAKETVSSVLLPVFSKEQSDIRKIHSMSRNSIRILCFVAFPVLIGFCLVSKEVVLLILTEKWIPMVPFLSIFCCLRLTDILKTIDIQVYFSLGKTKLYLIYAISICVLNIVLLFVSMFLGVIYIAYAALFVELISAIGVFLMSKKIYGYSIQERIADFRKPFLSTLVMSFAIIVLDKTVTVSTLSMLLIKILLGGVIYISFEIIQRDSVLSQLFLSVKSFSSKNKKQYSKERSDGLHD